MAKKKQRRQPVEFINLPKNNDSKNSSITDGYSVITTELYSSSENTKSTHSDYEDESSDVVSILNENVKKLLADKTISGPFTPSYHSVSQPSLSRTYDSGYDSASYDPVSDIISKDGSSPNNNRITKNSNALQCISRCLNSSDSHNSFVKAYRKRKGRPTVVSCHSLPPVEISASITSPIPQQTQHPNRLLEMKNRLRSLEVKYKYQKKASVVGPAASTATNSVTRNSKNSSAHIKSSSSQSSKEYEGLLLKESIMQTIGEIIGINVLLYVFYLIYILYKSSLSEAMEGDWISLEG